MAHDLTELEQLVPDHEVILDVAVRDIDYLGHMTASSFPAVYEEAVFRFIRAAWADPSPCYVDASVDVRYHHEVRLTSSPLNVGLTVVGVGRSSFRIRSVMKDRAGRICSSVETRYVAWDLAARTPRPLTDRERAALTFPREGAREVPRTC